MVIFLYGEDSFRSRQKLNEIIKKYRETQKESVNYFSFDFGIDDPKDFAGKLDLQSLFPEKKFIVCKNVFAKKEIKEYFIGFFSENKIDDDETVILFYESGASDEKDEFFKLLKKISKYQEFKVLDKVSLNKWILKEIENRGGSVDFAVAVKIAEIFGGDLWKISNEIDKLISFDKKITLENVALFFKAGAELNIFEFLDKIGVKNKKNSLFLLEKYFEEGENENYILAMILGQFRNLVKVASLNSISVAPAAKQAQIAKISGIHPFVVKKSLEKLKYFNKEKIKNIYSKICDVDFNIKTGRQDSKIALNLLVLESVK